MSQPQAPRIKQTSITKLDRLSVNLSLDNDESLPNNHIPKAGFTTKYHERFFIVWIDYYINIRFIRTVRGIKTVCII